MIEPRAKFQSQFYAQAFDNLLSKLCSLILQDFSSNPLPNMPIEQHTFTIYSTKSILPSLENQCFDVEK